MVKFSNVQSLIMSDNLARSILTDALITLANVFKEAGMNPPKKILVDKPTFDKLLAESMALYNIDTKKAIAEREFSLSDIMFIVEVEKTLTTENSANSSKEHSSQKPGPTTYQCPDCRIVFESKLDHRIHQQAFHDNIKDPDLL